MNKLVLVALAFLVLVAGTCLVGGALFTLGSATGDGESSSDYWTSGCVTGDEQLLIAGGSGAVALELDGGARVARHPQYVEAVSCAKRSGVAYAASETMVRLPSAEQVATDDPAASSLIDGSAVHYSRPYRDKRWRGYGSVASGAATLELTPQRFGVFREDRGVNAFLTWPGNVLPDGRLVVSAGWFPNRVGSVEAAPWGVFAVDAAAGAVQQLGATHHASDALNFSSARAVAASPDGRSHAVAFDADPFVHLALYADAEAPAATIDLDDARETTSLSYSPDGARVAIGTLAPGGEQSTVAVVDIATGRLAWRTAPAKGTVYLAQFLSDGSLVVMRSSRVVQRLEKNGTPRWTSPSN